MRDDEYFDAGETEAPESLAAGRWDAIGALVRHADAHLPFYRALWRQHGFTPAASTGPAEFARVPLTRKRDLVHAFQQAGSSRIGLEATLGQTPANLVMTSGTMGFNTFAALTEHDLDGASVLAQARELWMMRLRPGMRVLSISPAWHALGLFESRAISKIGAIPVLPWGTLTARFARDLLDAIRLLAPDHVLLTARALRMVLAQCDRLNVDPRRAFASVRYLGCAGEALSSVFCAHLRAKLELEDVFERGGSSDGMFGGADCFAHRGHHISADVHHVEVVDPRTGAPVAPGQRGTAVVTNLTLGKSVYIRFDTEDVAEIIPGHCRCGRTHPVIEFYGRLADSVIFPDRIVAPADVRTVLDELEATRFTPFSIDRQEEMLIIHLAADLGAVDRTAIAQACSARLSMPVAVVIGQVEKATWKEERIKGKAQP